MQAPDNSQPDQDEVLEAPPRLVAALKTLPQERLFVPPTLDESILRAARKHLEPPRRVRQGWFQWMPWTVAAAAMLVLLVSIPQFSKQKAHRTVRDSSLARWDLNHDGRIDILDAFTLARQLKAGTTPTLQFDLNGDGVVDERDVAALAARAVKLDRGTHS